MQGGVEQGVEEDEPCVRRLSDTELAMGWLGNGKDDESRDKKSDAGKQHLAASHVGLYAKIPHSHFDEWVSPTPCDGCGEGKDHYPKWTLEDASFFYRFLCQCHFLQGAEGMTRGNGMCMYV